MSLPSNPFVLLSYINTKLRDNYSSLDELVNDLDINKDDIIDLLKSINYEYKRNWGTSFDARIEGKVLEYEDKSQYFRIKSEQSIKQKR